MNALMLEQQGLEEQASEDQRNYASFVEATAAWEVRRAKVLGSPEEPGTIRSLEARIKHLREGSAQRLQELDVERKAIAAKIFEKIDEERAIYRELFAHVQSAASEHRFLRDSLHLEFGVVIDAQVLPERLLAMVHQGRKGSYYLQDEGRALLQNQIASANLDTWDGVRSLVDSILKALHQDVREEAATAVEVASQLRQEYTVEGVYDLLFGLSYLRPRLTLQLDGKEISELSPGERGILLLAFYLLLDKDEIPLIIDQPEHNLDNTSVYRLLEPCIRRAKNLRQIVLVTHNPNVAIVCDAEQVIRADMDKNDRNRVTYISGAIENPELNLEAVNVLEGTWPAFETRQASYQPVNLEA